MEKKYQVFVSSTYEDLKEERQKVMESLLQMNCFPVGMEYFNASDSSQWKVIESLIKECDYYVLIVAGKYGSIEEESGKSYTQKEFEYAVEQGVPIISFIHKDPQYLPAKYVDSDPKIKEKLEIFKSDVKKRLCKFWDSADDLASKVILSLNSIIKTNQRTGWVKADEVSSADANKQILSLKKENETLLSQIKFLSSQIPEETEIYKQGDDLFKVHYTHTFDLFDSTPSQNTYSKELSWNEIFLSISTLLLKPVDESNIRKKIEECLLGEYFDISDQDFQTILIQLMALKYIETDIFKSGGLYTYWILTSYGKSLMVKLKAQKK
ncbi:DUF4062 domain-containing protein [uncultured Bacteroides sp.]|uniref:DUF4062 domain-containing protein n=1 Tax=uncultured Bacteroides sp. TaxID=162156 RepID=UPI002AABD919|nr:DUF4062 domain-containing protein [uncultured Bacteroides sp.]